MPDAQIIDDPNTLLIEHGQRLTAVEAQQREHTRRADANDARTDTIIKDLAAVRAEGQQRSVSTLHSIDGLSTQIRELSVQMAAQTGAQNRDSEIRERELIHAQTRLANWKRWIAVIGLLIAILGTVISALLSWQEVASYIWVHILHWEEPWATLQTVNPPAP